MVGIGRPASTDEEHRSTLARNIGPIREGLGILRRNFVFAQLVDEPGAISEVHDATT
ncbi:MAG: hypothetical protein QM756_02510 [Polyangiaceae bacterium]